MGRGHSPLLRAPLSLLGRPRSVPETVDPEMTGTVLRGTQTSVPPSPGEGRGLFPPLSPLTSGSTAPTFSIKEQFPSSLGLSRQVLIVSDALLPHTQTRGMNLPLNTVELRDVLLPRTPLNSLWDWEDQVSADSSSLSLLRDATLPGLCHLSSHSCPTAGTSVTAPLIPLVQRLGAWLALPSPSCWLIRMVWLGYAIQFARRPPRFRGVLFTSVPMDKDASVLRAEIAVLLAKDAI